VPEADQRKQRSRIVIERGQKPSSFRLNPYPSAIGRLLGWRFNQIGNQKRRGYNTIGHTTSLRKYDFKLIRMKFRTTTHMSKILMDPPNLELV
jgi:hypothetical protein